MWQPYVTAMTYIAVMTYHYDDTSLPTVPKVASRSGSNRWAAPVIADPSGQCMKGRLRLKVNSSELNRQN